MPIAEAAAAAVAATCETARMSPAAAKPGAAIGTTTRRGWLRRLVTREYLPRSRRWKARPATDGAGGVAAGPSSYRRLASSLSRSLRWKRMPALPSLSLRAGSASAALDEVAFRVMYVVEAVVLGLALSCFFLCCGCHI
ncbi:uncharacterized protein LOC123450496 [Hordeum vulgare subsp. vulgare]|uniref:uncharacterized protein LOC123450496 n=1 Tax=Hordeum vulgare subsp. vulgare TaxID=112509 RepID=UPI000B461212|nr:uncharacterized protein LOC123450496 [Hordeum vulgare subsp. vulgare]